MRKGFRYRVRDMVSASDVILEVLDARFPNETRDEALEHSVQEKGKKLIFIVNKSDLVPKAFANKQLAKLRKRVPAVAFSARERYGTKALRTEIGKATHGKEARLCVLGYPNTGKSSVINLLRGKKVAATSPTAGFTKGEKFVRISSKLMLIDTPGVVPFEERDELRLALLGAKTPEQVEDAEAVAERIVNLVAEQNPGALKERYSVQPMGSPHKILESIAHSKKKFAKGGRPDLNATSAIVIRDWQKGRLSRFAAKD